ncbi:hypothetical protein BJV74DRAFT_556385 [Russula compacta]|nr:hypothetical protein BJV74DRAFT_556385 [Russula compacta]
MFHSLLPSLLWTRGHAGSVYITSRQQFPEPFLPVPAVLYSPYISLLRCTSNFRSLSFIPLNRNLYGRLHTSDHLFLKTCSTCYQMSTHKVHAQANRCRCAQG